jgi:hypothetical protein
MVEPGENLITGERFFLRSKGGSAQAIHKKRSAESHDFNDRKKNRTKGRRFSPLYQAG